MFAMLRNFSDRLLGRGNAAITVPIMDGALKPNRELDEAEVVLSLADIDDLATDGHSLYASAGHCIYRVEDHQLIKLRTFDFEVTALAVRSTGQLAVALAGRRVLLFDNIANGDLEIASLEGLGSGPLRSVNSLHFEADGSLLLSDGSTHCGPEQWCLDLMEKGQKGRVARWDVATGKTEILGEGLHYAFGVLPLDGSVLYSESWRHRVARAGKTRNAPNTPFSAELPSYPSRMARATDGGLWVSCFVSRTQLVEFVLREDAYRKRMLAEVDPRYWIAPALRSGASYLEPLQGAGVKQMGVLKPWAPPRSYGMVLRLDAQGRTLQSLHSQVDGRHHGVTAIVEFDGALYVASKGSGSLLRVPLVQGEAT